MSVKRINALRKKMREENLDGLIVNNLSQVRYLSGYTGSSGLLIITGNSADFFTDFRYTDQARKEVTGAKIHIIKSGFATALVDFPQFDVRNRKYGYDGEHLAVAERSRLKKSLGKSVLLPAPDAFAELGWVKDREEIAEITKAVKITDTVFERILPLIVPGVRETELAAEMEYQMKMLGSEDPAFETIVASGYRSAMPHGTASAKKVKKGEFVTFDFGATVNGYVSDITRTVVVGKATTRQKKIYGIVLRAQKAGIRKIKAGVTGVAVDAACRNIITRAGYGKQFGHGTGHGIGFVVHHGPSLGAKSTDKLLTNNVITVEPGIYISGWGGIRIEDDVVVTRTGSRVLTKAPKNLLEL
jgi:Xaa-Pro aminopeptidase